MSSNLVLFRLNPVHFGPNNFNFSNVIEHSYKEFLRVFFAIAAGDAFFLY